MEGSCPKCGAPRTGAESCPRCGVVFARFDPAALEAGVPDDIKALWAHVEAGWDDRARHALFTETAIARGEAAYAASRYRARGTGDRTAAEQLERISARLEQTLAQAVRAGPPHAVDPGRKRALLFLVAIILLLLIGAIGLALVRR